MKKEQNSDHLNNDIIKKVSYTTNHPSEKYPAENSFNLLWKKIQKDQQKTKIKKLRPWKYVAAASIVILLIGTYWFSGYRTKEETHMLLVEAGRKQYTLPDGTLVWLNSSSNLTYIDRYGNEERKVELNGEAYFEVVKNTEKPFIVSTGHSNVSVLGTSFNIRSYPDEINIVTTLIEGSVHIDKGIDNNGSILSPGQQLLLNKKSNHVSLHEVDVTLYTAWKDGRLIFQQTAIENVFSELERVFRIKIQIENQHLKDRKITGRFSIDNGPEAILDIMKESMPFDYNIQDHTITIQ
ncbi:MAG: FecR domain-containing protein [Bacteroidales bacterium]|nr:FecR domain-containing protein [Bacteroidales bacterium]